jgi:hypothetical protein
MSKAISHHKSTSAEYTSWRAMRERCYNKKSKAYSRYGGRGVVVCEEWKHSFETFFNDMGKKPSEKHSLDRIDPNKEYSKENCRWVLPTTQSFNQRIRKDNSSGYPGIRYDTKLKKWVSTIGASGSQGHYLGVFSSFEEAVEKRLEAELMQYGEYKLKSGQ